MTLIDKLDEHGFFVQDAFLPQAHFQGLYNTAEQYCQANVFRAAKVGSNANAALNQTIRQDNIHWLDKSDDNIHVTQYLMLMDSLAQQLNAAFYLNLYEIEAHFAHYPEGAFYKKHRDQFQHNKRRQISCVYYLNQQWQAKDGGELVLYDDHENEIETITPVGNRFVCFRSHILHEVKQTHAPRFSIAGWMKTRS